MSVMELTKNKKYRIEIVLGYNGNKKSDTLKHFMEKRVKLKQWNLSLEKY